MTFPVAPLPVPLSQPRSRLSRPNQGQTIDSFIHGISEMIIEDKGLLEEVASKPSQAGVHDVDICN
ncbi:hypothetical protein [Synechococcus sp. RedBA-s]|uniref:hypothetical protein n=1 Tax=Synechococcus sp. RedBA-s TaxID=2823741 RepID=UPI0020CC4582|nr:hypothetical protein [Synechococcus sp. RedBA-s]MCP9800233.1 hypothetical protein [Synechococcus sp. RedBA-s]